MKRHAKRKGFVKRAPKGFSLYDAFRTTEQATQYLMDYKRVFKTRRARIVTRKTSSPLKFELWT